MIAKIHTEFNIPAREAWNALMKRDTFLYITRGFLGFEGSNRWPETFFKGQKIHTRLIFFHVLPAWRHVLKVARLDNLKRELYSNEKCGPIDVWNHLIKIEPISERRCRYTDQIEIRAGLITFGIWLYAHLFYRYRQYRWQRLIQQRQNP